MSVCGEWDTLAKELEAAESYDRCLEDRIEQLCARIDRLNVRIAELTARSAESEQHFREIRERNLTLAS